MPFLYLRRHTRPSLAGQGPSQPVQRADEEPFPPIFQAGKLVGYDAMAQVPCFVSWIPIHQPLHGFKKKGYETDGSIISRPAVGVPAGLRYKHYLNLSPYGRNIASRQAGTKYSDQVWKDNLPSLLQHGREYAIHPWTFIWGKRIYSSFYHSVGDHPRSQPPVGTSWKLFRLALSTHHITELTPHSTFCVYVTINN